MDNLFRLKCLIVGIISTCVLHVQSIYYLEDACELTGFSQQFFNTPYPNWNYSSVHYLEASRSGTYATGVTCNLGLRLAPSAFDFIISIKRVQFRIGYQDYLNITDNNNRTTHLTAFRNEYDSHMQFYGKQFLLQYSTETGGPYPLEYIGFSLSLTIAENKTLCDTLRGFRCKNGYCIDRSLRCDDTNNCGDFSDEDRCDKIIGGMDSTPGTVVLISMFLMSIVGLIGGFIISMCLTTFITEVVKMHRGGRQPLRASSVDSTGSSSPSHLLHRS